MRRLARILLFFSLSNPLTFSLYIYTFQKFYLLQRTFANRLLLLPLEGVCRTTVWKENMGREKRREWKWVCIWLIVSNISQQNIRSVRQNVKNRKTECEKYNFIDYVQKEIRFFLTSNTWPSGQELEISKSDFKDKLNDFCYLWSYDVYAYWKDRWSYTNDY